MQLAPVGLGVGDVVLIVLAEVVLLMLEDEEHTGLAAQLPTG